VLVHGNPAWGYLHRNFIPPLVEAGYRVIVPDLLGAGAATRQTGPTRSGVTPNGAAVESLDHAVVTRVPDAGHFVQEDAYERG
jgi:pimeloyl-ACP methyl ester carboxylesterase